MPTDAPGSVVPTERHVATTPRGFTLTTRIAVTTTAAAVLAVIVAALVAWPLAQATAEQDSLVGLQRLADATAAAVERNPDAGSELIGSRLAETFRSQQYHRVLCDRGRADTLDCRSKGHQRVGSRGTS